MADTSGISRQHPEKVPLFRSGSQDDISTITRIAPMLNEDSVNCLESMFRTIRYPSDSVIEYLADDLRVPMAAIKTWFKKKRGEGRKSMRKLDSGVIKLDYEPVCGLGGLRQFGISQSSESETLTTSVGEVEKQLDKLNFDDRNDKVSSSTAADKDTILFVHDIVGSLIQIRPFPVETLVTNDVDNQLPELEKIVPCASYGQNSS